MPKTFEPFKPGDRIEIVRKGTVRHTGVVTERTLHDHHSYGADDETLRTEIDGLGMRVFHREISFRGNIGGWRPRAKDLKKIGAFRIRLAPVSEFTDEEIDAIEADAVQNMGGDDFATYEEMTGKEIGNK